MSSVHICTVHMYLRKAIKKEETLDIPPPHHHSPLVSRSFNQLFFYRILLLILCGSKSDLVAMNLSCCLIMELAENLRWRGGAFLSLAARFISISYFVLWIGWVMAPLMSPPTLAKKSSTSCILLLALSGTFPSLWLGY